MRTSNILVLLALLLSLCDPKHNVGFSWQKEPLTIVQPESQGFSSQRLLRIDSVLQEFIDQKRIAGATALVARKGDIVYFKSNGYFDLEKRILLEKNAIFRIASQTKAITSVAVMMFYEEGRISLNDPISKYLPIFLDPQVVLTFNKQDSSYTSKAAAREVTIHDLLTHTSGYSYPGNGGEAFNAICAKKRVENGISASMQEEMRNIASVPLAHEPGEKFSYGLSTDILGALVEELSGQTLEDFFRARIFDPLGMKDTYFKLPVEKHSRLMPLYQTNIDGRGIKISTGDYLNFPLKEPDYYSGGAGLSSTALDFAIFEQMLLNGGEYNGNRILGRKTIEMMNSNQIGDLSAGSLFIPGSTDRFGLGFEVISPPGSSLVLLSDGSFGWGGAFGSLYWIDPKEELIVHFVIQLEGGSYGDIRDKFIAVVYQALE